MLTLFARVLELELATAVSVCTCN